MKHALKAVSAVALLALFTGCGSNNQEKTDSKDTQPTNSTVAASATASPTQAVSSQATPSPHSTASPSATAPSPIPENSSQDRPQPSATPTQAAEPSKQATEPVANPSWCNPQGGPGVETIETCPPMPNYPIVVHNEQEAAEYLLEQKFQNNPDITAAVTQVLPDVQGAPGQYVVVARSESMRQAGGSGTVGTFLVTPEGNWGEADPSMIPQNG